MFDQSVVFLDVETTGATASITFVPPAFCMDSIMEAADAGIRFLVSITDGIPAQDMIQVKHFLQRRPLGERRATAVAPSPPAWRCARFTYDQALSRLALIAASLSL